MPASASTERHALDAFRETILSYYDKHGRQLPWRPTVDPNPYHIFVSEMMLQQTQVSRVIEKYGQFIRRLPSFNDLAAASFALVLELWYGLGYYRRARYLHQAAQIIVDRHGGLLPADVATLRQLPGIGVNTAGALRVFAYNLPAIFIETNIRRTYIQFFFAGQEAINDREIMELVEQTLPAANPRRWYSALMDYGDMLARTSINPNRRSAHYTRQSPFAGSNRQLRGAILRQLLQQNAVGARCSATQLRQTLTNRYRCDVERLEQVIEQLENEGFIACEAGRVLLRGSEADSSTAKESRGDAQR